MSFQSTHPLRGATLNENVCPRLILISIHAPLAGCDPRRRPLSASALPFQSTHPLRGATAKHNEVVERTYISIHAPLAGCDICARRRPRRSRHFNPRTPCGVRQAACLSTPTLSPFQSTHPLRGATQIGVWAKLDDGISIHAPLAGCDAQTTQRPPSSLHFNPRTPCGVRQSYQTRLRHEGHFNPRTPCGVRREVTQ